MSIELDPITSGFNLSKINNNFQKVENELNDNVLRRDGLDSGEPNHMNVNLDMNSFTILNAKVNGQDLDDLVDQLLDAIELEQQLEDILNQIINGGGFNIGTAITSVAVLRSVEPVADRQVAYVISYYPFGKVGGGYFYYDQADVTTADNEGTVIVTAGGKRWKRIVDNTLTGEMFGVVGNNSGSPYSTQIVNLFNASVGFSKVVLPNAPIYWNNSTVASFQAGVEYVGGGSTEFILMDKTKRGFLTQSKDGFVLNSIGLSCSDETMPGGLGGGYIQIRSSNKFLIKNCRVGKTAWDGLKCFECNYFTITGHTGKWNKSSAIQLEGCTNYVVEESELSLNGRMSTDNSYAVPGAGLVSLVGRGITTYSSSGVDNFKGTLRNITATQNAEFNIRIFAEAGVRGSTAITIENCIVEDGGYPAGTYGSLVLVDKGADIIINSGDTNTSGCSVRNNRIVRNYSYGLPMTIAGDDISISDNKIIIQGAGLNILPAYFIFSGSNNRLTDNISYGSGSHIQFGSGSPSTISIRNDIAYNTLRFKLSNCGGFNTCKGVSAYHISATAVTGEIGFQFADNWILDSSYFSGFHQSIVYSSGDVFLKDNITVSSANVGFRNFSNTSTTLTQSGNSFDSVSPNELGTVMWDARNPQAAGISFNFVIPSSGYYKAGHIVFDTQLDALSSGKRSLGWRRITTGTAHVINVDWEQMFYTNS